jgi:membrane-associated protein
MCAYLGVLASDSIWYWLCFIYGAPLLHKKWFKRLAHPRRLLQAKHQMEKRGAWVIVTGRFLPGSRTAAVVMAGLLHMPPWKYYATEGVCAAATVSLQMGAGYLIARGIGSQNLFGTVLTIVAVLVVMFATTLGIRLFVAHRKKATQAPRAKAAWLRKFRPRRLKAGPQSPTV